MEAIVKGWLIKSPPEYKGSFKLFSAKWRRRYFVLYAPPTSALPNAKAIMEYYSKSKMENKIGFINLVDCDEVLSNIRTDIYKYVFSMRTKHKGLARTYFFAPDTELEMKMWVEKLCFYLGLKENEKKLDIQRQRHISTGSALFPKAPVGLSKNIMQDDSALLKPRNLENLKMSLRGAESSPHLDRCSGVPPPLPPNKRHEAEEPKKPSRDKKNKSSDDLRKVEFCHDFEDKDIRIKNLQYDAPSITKSLENLCSNDEVLYKRPSAEKMTINTQISDVSHLKNSHVYSQPVNRASKNDFKKDEFKTNAKISLSYPTSQYEQMYDKPNNNHNIKDPKIEKMKINTQIYDSVPHTQKEIYDRPVKTTMALQTKDNLELYDKPLSENNLGQTINIQCPIFNEGIYNKPKTNEKNKHWNKNDNFDIYNIPKANSNDIYNNINSYANNVQVIEDKNLKMIPHDNIYVKASHFDDFHSIKTPPVIGRKAQNLNLRSNNNLYIQPTIHNYDSEAKIDTNKKEYENFKMTNDYSIKDREQNQLEAKMSGKNYFLSDNQSSISSEDMTDDDEGETDL